jgi:DegV family protein with EDD domain
MPNIRITSDTISDLGPELLEKYKIDTFPLMINMGEESIPDGPGVPEKIFAFAERTGKLPKTAARGEEEYYEFFKTRKPAGGELVHFCISSEISASFSAASAAAKRIEGVYVIDTRSLSTGSGLSVMYACDLKNEGVLSGKEIADKCVARAKYVQASFVLDSLEFLHKGGRCSGLTAFVASVLHIKPMILLKDGHMGVGKKYMTRFEKAVERYIDDIFEKFSAPDLTRVFITFTPLPEGMAEHVKKRVLEKYPFKEVHLTVAGGTITSHCGKNTIGILYYNDGKKE